MADPGANIEFGPFRLEPGERRLTQNGQPVAVTPKAFDLLVILAANPGRLLKKEDLLERLWPGVFVEEVNLAQNISALRKALGGDGRDTYIQTVAGTGYRFAAEVRPPAAPQPAAPAKPPRERLMVLPFRMLKPDPELDFLAFSLPDAVTAELAAIDSIIVRSSLMAAKFAGESPDLARIAREAQVDFVVSGTLLRAGDQLRVSAQLADATAGTLIWSHTAQAPVNDLFQLQDSLAARIVGSLSHPLTLPEQRRLKHDVPATAKAYELYLRGNQVSPPSAFDIERATGARDLYLQSIAEDPAYAPTWTRLARMYRLLGKYLTDDADINLRKADDALQRALALNPDLSLAHSLYAQIDVDRGLAADAMKRLLQRLDQRGPNAEIYAALVQACRFCGLHEASLAAHEHAHRYDPALPTSAMQTYFVMRRFQDVIDVSGDVKGYVYSLSLEGVGRGREAIENLSALERKGGAMLDMLAAARELIAGNHAESAAAMTRAMKTFADPEAFYHAAGHLARCGVVDASLDALSTSIAGGYTCLKPLEDPWFDAVRSQPKFSVLMDQARRRHDDAVAVFRQADGARHLGTG